MKKHSSPMASGLASQAGGTVMARDEAALKRSKKPRAAAAPPPDRFDCARCQALGVEVDEDGCCATCGVDAIAVRGGVPTYPPPDTQDEDQLAAIEALFAGRPMDRASRTWGTPSRVLVLHSALAEVLDRLARNDLAPKLIGLDPEWFDRARVALRGGMEFGEGPSQPGQAPTGEPTPVAPRPGDT